MPEDQIKILVFAYACNPEFGSEPGVGWMWSRMLTRLGDVWVITRSDNADAIEGGLSSAAEGSKLHFHYVPAQETGSMTHFRYWIWQIKALNMAKRLHQQENFHVAWHLTYANAWLGSLASLVGPRFVYGPVGGGVSMPWPLLVTVGGRGAFFECVRAAVRFACRYFNPIARLSWRRAVLILANNEETRRWFPKRYRHKIEVFHNAVLPDRSWDKDPNNAERKGTVALFAGRLVPWKGVSLAIDAIAGAPEWSLIVCGSGSDLNRLKARTKRRCIEDRVHFFGNISRDALLDLMRESAGVFIFPSLHDDAPCVVLEAAASGLDVICVDRGGPPALLGGRALAVKPGLRRGVVRNLRRELEAAALKPSSTNRPVFQPPLIDVRMDDLSKLIHSKPILSRLGTSGQSQQDLDTP